jgi:hypothetical protein
LENIFNLVTIGDPLVLINNHAREEAQFPAIYQI